MEKEMKNWSKK